MSAETEKGPGDLRPLLYSDLVPIYPYTLATLVHMQVLDLETAVEASGQEVSIFDTSTRWQEFARDFVGDEPAVEGGLLDLNTRHFFL